MEKLERIKRDIMHEVMSEERPLESIEFNRRGGEVVMNYVYSTHLNVHDDPHYIPHNKDPEWLDISEMASIETYLNNQGIKYNERRDKFI